MIKVNELTNLPQTDHYAILEETHKFIDWHVSSETKPKICYTAFNTYDAMVEYVSNSENKLNIRMLNVQSVTPTI